MEHQPPQLNGAGGSGAMNGEGKSLSRAASVPRHLRLSPTSSGPAEGFPVGGSNNSHHHHHHQSGAFSTQDFSENTFTGLDDTGFVNRLRPMEADSRYGTHAWKDWMGTAACLPACLPACLSPLAFAFLSSTPSLPTATIARTHTCTHACITHTTFLGPSKTIARPSLALGNNRCEADNSSSSRHSRSSSRSSGGEGRR